MLERSELVDQDLQNFLVNLCLFSITFGVTLLYGSLQGRICLKSAQRQVTIKQNDCYELTRRNNALS